MSAGAADRGVVKRTLAAALAVLVASALGGCGESTSAPDVTTVHLWSHDGTDAERQVLEQQVKAFNRSHPRIKVVARFVAEGDYNDELQAAVARRALPDVTEVDGPLLRGYAYQRVLTPLDGILAPEALADQLPSLQAQGTFDGHTYAVGTFDSGLGLYADRRALVAAGVRSWPRTADEAWTAAQFAEVLSRLAAHDPDGKVLDVKVNYGVGEWLTYGFAPLVASAGGSLIDSATLAPGGHLDGQATRSALATVRSWASYVDPNADDQAFVKRRVAVSWVGHWVYGDYAKALGEDLVVLPLPDLGNGSKTGQGSWAWTVTTTKDARKRAAATFLEYLLRDEEVLRMTAANGAVPGNESALASSPLYAQGGPLRLFADQLLHSCGADRPTRSCVAVPRPVTPGYAVLSSQFALAVSQALGGKAPGPALEAATSFVQQDLAANDHFR